MVGAVTPLADLVATSGPLRAWLESLPPDAVAGRKDNVRECPVAHCLRAAGYPWAAADGLRAYYTERDDEREGKVCAKTLRRFVGLVDRTRSPLTARKCLALLDRAEREVQP